MANTFTYKREIWTETQRKVAMWRWRQRLKLYRHMPRNAWGYQKLKKQERTLLWESFKGTQTCRHLHFRLLASWTVKEYISIILSHLVCDNCYGSPRKLLGLPWWFSDKEPTWQWVRLRISPWVEKILWRSKWQPTPVLLEKSQRQGNLVGYIKTKSQESFYLI